MDLGPTSLDVAPVARKPIGNVHVEGGSGPQPPHAAPDVDPEIAEMDATVGGRDIFGRIEPLA
jgi:hypothetical protein